MCGGKDGVKEDEESVFERSEECALSAVLNLSVHSAPDSPPSLFPLDLNRLAFC